MVVGVVGARGYVGSELVKAFEGVPSCEAVSITRENYPAMQAGEYDVLVNAAMPSARFWAKNHPREDFAETVQKTADLVYGWRFKKFVHISSVSARCQLDTVYGRHKAAAEALVHFGGNLIVRFGALYSDGLKKGVLMDMLHGRQVFVDGKSRYCFTPLAFAAGWVAKNFERTGIVEVGAKHAIPLEEVARRIKARVEFEGALDHQEIQNPEPDFPEARDVLAFMEVAKQRMHRVQ
ncbi:MAG: NAD(P)-dependent oxidoreductase [Candidatus Liptonbacteria bacterium]|nr:NAD(P)-dependent oxidoreductase [Candidatus Liptonbacteria bacterium]MBI3114741.1 NAD(P)-dependent oxidoreductase [Candidatus Harrisonbacteria bacterium]